MARYLLLYVLLMAWPGAAERNKQVSPLDQYVADAITREQTSRANENSGSLWIAQAPLGDLARDVRAALVDDIVTIVISDRASATAKGTTETARKSNTKASIGSVWGGARPQLANLASASGETTLSGQGSTTRETVLSTTLSARVTHVLPNGNLVVEGSKETVVNSERQIVTVRGVLRPVDLTPENLVRSDRLAMLEVRVNGKGVVDDAIRRPMFLYRLLLGLLPF